MTEVRYAVAGITGVDVRDPSSTDDNTYTMSGYAAVFDQRTTLYDGKFVQIDEQIDGKAFNTVLRDQPMTDAAGAVHFNFGHDMNRAVAATNIPAGQPGSLTLKADDQGLFFLAKVPRDDPDGVALAVKMRSGVVGQASFAFTIGGIDTVETEDEDTGRVLYSDTITAVKHLYDVCACAQGAYSQTVSGLRSYAAAIGQPLEGGHPRQPEGGAIPVSPETGGEVDITSPVVVEWPDLREQAFRLRPIGGNHGKDRDVHRGHQVPGTGRGI